MDRVSKKIRSGIMASVRPKGNRTTESRFRAYLVSYGIRGWKMHPKNILGTPDFYFPRKKIVVFVDGCFWHGCRKCKNIPKSNRSYWQAKIEENKRRDRKIDRNLKNHGYLVKRIWEHDIKTKPNKIIDKLKISLKK